MSQVYDYVIVGGGPASVWAASSLRETDKEGSILLIGQEPHPPYDRPPLSKKMLLQDDVPVDDPYTKFDEFYPDHQIELKKKTKVVSINRLEKTVTLDDHTQIGYKKLLLATGSRPKTPDFPGSTLPDVFLLRTIEDSLQIRDALKTHRSLLLVGSGYIGMEVAAAGIGRGLEVTIADPAPHPWSKFASPKFGNFIQNYYEKQGVNFLMGEEVLELKETIGGGITAFFRSGKKIEVDMVVVGVGAQLNVELALESGLSGDAKTGIHTDATLKTDDPDIYAAGDIACFEDTVMGQKWHLEHHLNAKWQGQTAGKNLTGAGEPYARVPYFFSDEFDLHVILRGLGKGGEQTLILGDTEAAEFIELYSGEDGLLRMGIAVSKSEETCDAYADKFEALILKKYNVRENTRQLLQKGGL